MSFYLLPVIFLLFTKPTISVSLLTNVGIEPVMTDQLARELKQPRDFPVDEMPARDEADLLTKYPGMFKTWRELPDYKPNLNFIKPSGWIQSIDSITGEGHTSRTSYHGCCISEPRLESFNTLSDPMGNTVQLVQQGPRKQYFPTETCNQDPKCSNSNCRCSCTMVYQTMTALVYKPGQTKDVIFGFVNVPSFCRCMNNLKRDLK